MHAVPEQAVFPTAPLSDEAPGAIAPVDRVRAWMEIAKTGDEMIYSSRRAMGLPARSETVRLVRDLIAKGMVHPIQRPIESAPGHKNYVIQRSSKKLPAAKPKPAPAPTPSRVDEEAAAINALFPTLKRIARFGRPCPTDRQLSKLARVPFADVGPTLSAMQEMGMIRVAGVRAPTLRLVTIVETGHRTGFIE